MSDEDKYIARTERMLTRWSGQRLSVTRRATTEGDLIRHTPPAAGKIDLESGNYIEPARELPILAQCDVLVVGAGPAGLSAALAARRAGADTVLLERFGCFGGVITTVGMETLAWYRYEGTVEGEGIGIEMERIAAQMGGSIKWPYNDSQCLDADFFKVVADRLISEAGVRPI
jgi:NADPH-dependent 2,4-dienoyl-CoA reductase/sulfur reductase-like enzyme